MFRIEYLSENIECGSLSLYSREYMFIPNKEDEIQVTFVCGTNLYYYRINLAQNFKVNLSLALETYTEQNSKFAFDCDYSKVRLRINASNLISDTVGHTDVYFTIQLPQKNYGCQLALVGIFALGLLFIMGLRQKQT